VDAQTQGAHGDRMTTDAKIDSNGELGGGTFDLCLETWERVWLGLGKSAEAASPSLKSGGHPWFTCTWKWRGGSDTPIQVRDDPVACAPLTDGSYRSAVWGVVLMCRL
jgi:hypothetical protein